MPLISSMSFSWLNNIQNFSHVIIRRWVGFSTARCCLYLIIINSSPAAKIDKHEQKVFQDVLRLYEQSLLPNPLKQPLLSMSVLKNSVAMHNKRQTEYFGKLLRSPSSAHENMVSKEKDDSDMDVDSNHGDNCDILPHVNGKLITAKGQPTPPKTGITNCPSPNGPPALQIINVSSNHIPNLMSIQLPKDVDKHIQNLVSRPPPPFIPNLPNPIIPLIPAVPQQLPKEIIPPPEPEPIPAKVISHEAFGQFKYIRLDMRKLSQQQSQIRSKYMKSQRLPTSNYTKRRTTYLDSGIFQKMEDSPFCSVYTG